MMSWTVLHVRPRCEKKMAEYCEFYGVTHYLPLRSKTKVYQRRKVTFDLPVFPSYVFAEVPGEKRDLILRSRSLARMIEVKDHERFVWELDQVKKALDVDPTLGATSAFTRGKVVRIVGRPGRSPGAKFG